MTAMSDRVPLRERKQQRVREQIIKAAFELFAERGYAHVTVADIAERAEVGRTTFFRYFGDKQEVVFYEEQAILDGIIERHGALTPERPTLAEAVEHLRAATVAICEDVTSDAEHYLTYLRLVNETPELRDRSTRKFALYTGTLTENLRERGATELVATLAPQLALACFNAAVQLAGDDPEALPRAVDAAFDELTAR
ncbi:hypothetical protein BAY59_25010 [Prauserella coralliicola]|nr:hypothetical protein BAY59_25010 [Prauserella coralliicola]